jgi:primosomal protein N'
MLNRTIIVCPCCGNQIHKPNYKLLLSVSNNKNTIECTRCYRKLILD